MKIKSVILVIAFIGLFIFVLKYIFTDTNDKEKTSEFSQTKNSKQPEKKGLVEKSEKIIFKKSRNKEVNSSLKPEPLKDYEKIEIPALEKIVGKETKEAIQNGGPYKDKDVREMAKGLINLEGLLMKYSNKNVDPEQMELLTHEYVDLQNAYYAAQMQFDPKKIDPKAAERIKRFKEAVEGKKITVEELKDLKRTIMMTKEQEPEMQ